MRGNEAEGFNFEKLKNALNYDCEGTFFVKGLGIYLEGGWSRCSNGSVIVLYI